MIDLIFLTIWVDKFQNKMTKNPEVKNPYKFLSFQIIYMKFWLGAAGVL